MTNNTRKAKTDWDVDRGVTFIRGLQSWAWKYGYHLALAGGILNNGRSDKDLDVAVLPYRTERDWEGFSRAIASAGVKDLRRLGGESYPDMPTDKTEIFAGDHPFGRVDFIVNTP